MRPVDLRSRACVLAAIVLVAAGCTKSKTAENSGQRAMARTITFNISEDPHSLDPVLGQNDDERQIAHLMFDLLLDVDSRGKQVPALAAVVPSTINHGIRDGGRTITYHLRRDVLWHDGKPLTAHDVWFTWQAIVDKRNDVQSTHGYDLISKIDTPDRFTAVVHLTRPWAPAVATLFTYGTNPMPILPAHVLEDKGPLARLPFNTEPIGSGPYRFESWDRGNRLTFAANPGYFRGPPRTPLIVAQEVPDLNTDLTLLRSGQLDWTLLSPAQRLSLGKPDGLHFIYAPFSGFGAIAFNCRKWPLDDARMRRGIAMSIDRQRLSDGITKGQYPVTDSDQPRFSWAYDPAVRFPGYDTTAADGIFKSLGWRRDAEGMLRRGGRPLALVFVTFPEGDTAVRTAEYVERMLRERGIAVTIKKVSVTQFYLPKSERGLLMSGGFDMAYFAWRSGEDPDDSDIVTCRGPSNYAGYCSAAVDDLESNALRVTEVKRRKALYSRVQRALAADVPYYFLYAPKYGFAARDGLRGFAPSPLSPTWNAYQWSALR